MARTTIRTEDITADAVTSAKIAAGAVDTTGLEDDIALLGFKVAANGSLAAYNLHDQTIDTFEDASGVDASESTDEVRTGTYYSGKSGGDTLTAFTSTGSATWTCPSGTTNVEVLVVAGGGAGGGAVGSGGGAGGIVHDADYSVTASVVYDLTVGAAGGDSVWNVNAEGSGLALTASGGGAGTPRQDAGGGTGGTGGSGGGGGYGTGSGGSTDQASFTGATSYGYAGSSATGHSTYASGGGGGASETVSNSGQPDGGDGVLFSTFVAYGTTSANVASSGSDGGYFGGGGGGAVNSVWNGTAGEAGVGGGGVGTKGGAGGSGMANTGGGGGGGNASNAGSGGSGVVLVKENQSFEDMTLISNATTAESTPTTGDIVMTYTNGAGTATVNIDLKAYVSRDDGTTWTPTTLSSEGTTGGHTILTAHNVDISSQPSGTSMRYKIETLNQSVSKETRIQAISLGWS